MGGDRRPRVLVVDDDRSFADLLAEFLEQEDYCVYRAYDGGQALGMLMDGHQPDVVVSDIMMPRLSGRELVDAARQLYQPKELPFILLSAARDPRLTAEYVWFMSKPVDMYGLLSQVETAVEVRNTSAR